MGLNFAQIAWVVKDITVAERFFKGLMAISNFGKVETLTTEIMDITKEGEEQVQKMKN